MEILTVFQLKGINGEPNKEGLIENFWLAMTRVLDPRVDRPQTRCDLMVASQP